MSWRNRYKIYKTSDPRLVITAVCSFPNIYDTLEKCIEYYKIKRIQEDLIFREIYSDYEFQHGCDFIPIYFEDECPKLQKLAKLKDLGKGWFWCIGLLPKGFKMD